MTEEEEIIFAEEEQVYKDHLKRIGKNINDRISDEFKKINFIENYYSHFAGEIDTSVLSDTFQRVAPVLRENEITRTRLENTIKTLKYVLYELRNLLNQFEEREGIYYEFGLAQLLARRENIRPEQVAPLNLKDLPDFNSIGGKRKTKKSKTLKKRKTTKKR